jgi:polyisoprenoid-binding protein YceI
MMKYAVAIAGLSIAGFVCVFASADAQQAPSSRTLAGAARPAATQASYLAPAANAAMAPAGTYKTDPGHSSVTAQIRRQGLSNFTFRFDKFAADFTYDPANPEASHVEARLDPKSVDANVALWTQHLQAPEYLDTARFTDIVFTSTSFKRIGRTTGELAGNVSFLGVVKPVTILVTLNGVSPGDAPVIGFSGETSIKMSDFPMPGFAALHLGDEVRFDIEAEFVKS